MDNIRRIALKIDSFFEGFALCSIFMMVIIVAVQVFTRKVFSFVFFWSEEITLLLLAWFTYMGIAIGFRENLHLEMDLIENIAPAWFNRVLDVVIRIATFIFGIYLVYYGWDFCVLTWDSTLPATKLPNSTLYAVVPLTGVMICVYSALQLMGINTNRHQDILEIEGEEIKE